MKKIASILFACFLMANIAGCGSDGSSNLSVQEQRDVVYSFLSSLTFFTSGYTSTAALQTQTSTINCETSGTIIISEDGIDYDNCDLGQGLVIDGLISIIDNGTTLTIDYNNLKFTDPDSGTTTMDGAITLEIATDTVTYDGFSISNGGDTFTIDAVLVANGDGTVDGDLTMTINGNVVADCTFDNFSGTEQEIDNSCDII